MSTQSAAQLVHQVRMQCADAYALYDAGAYKEALRLFYQAWLLLPKPQTNYEAAGWVLTAIGDTYFRLEQYQQGKEALTSALYCPNTRNSAFAHLRLGQCLWELDQQDQARAALMQAYDIARMNIFATEDNKYYLAISELLTRQRLTQQQLTQQGLKNSSSAAPTIATTTKEG